MSSIESRAAMALNKAGRSGFLLGRFLDNLRVMLIEVQCGIKLRLLQLQFLQPRLVLDGR